MPHSPRWHDGRLWALNSGAGELLAIDPTRGRGDVVCVLPGFLRGMSLHGPFAIIGMSSLRVRHLFSGLPVQERFGRLLCGVSVVDLRSGSVIGQLEFTSGCEELYEVATLPGLDRPMLLNLGSGMARHAFATPQGSCWSERGEPATSLPIPLS